MDQVLEILRTLGMLLWYTLWAFILGYLVSSIIQVLFTREQMSRVLGERGWWQATLSGFFGFISSSCSFASLAATRSVMAKGAHAANAIAFMVATTNLVIELGIVLWILVGWKFVVANFLLGILMILYVYAMTYVALPKRIAEGGREHAEHLEAQELKHPTPEGMRWWQKLTSKEGWKIISFKFFGELKMAYKEVLVGFTIASAISVLVPVSWWNALFAPGTTESPSFLTVLQHSLVAPLIALVTFVGSLGNVPLAGVLWSKNASFGGVIAFLGADLISATVIWLNIKYYGWKFALWISPLLYVGMVLSGLTVHYLFAAFGAIPTARPESLEKMMQIEFSLTNHTFVLNIVFGIIAVALLVNRWGIMKQQQ